MHIMKKARNLRSNVTRPFIAVTEPGTRYLVTSSSEAIIGPDKWNARPLSDLSNATKLGLSEAEPLAEPTAGAAGEMLRLVLADQFLDGAGDGLSLALRANIDPHEFQIRPILKFNTTADRRLLIADETGLGKTIEAGMVIVETLAANLEGTIIILSPASVVSKWISEMREKFGVRAIRGRLQDFDGGGAEPGVYVVSHGSMPRADSVDVLDGSIDLLVIDEVHRFIGRTDQQKRRGRTLCLSKASRGVIGLSATPIQIEMEDLQRILDLIAPSQHPAATYGQDVELQVAINRIISAQRGSVAASDSDLSVVAPHLPVDGPLDVDDLRVPMDRGDWAAAHLQLQSIGPIGRRMTRARARDPDVGQAKERRVSDHYVDPGEHGALLWEIDAVLARNRGRHSNRQQLASCPSAAVAILSHILGSRSPDDGSDWADDYDQVQTTPEEYAELPALKKEAERQMLGSSGPKIEKLVEILEDLASRVDDEESPITKVVVFTHWIPTLMHAPRLIRAKTGFNVHVISPGDDHKAADSKVKRFRAEEGFSVLFVSDRMSIGIDLEMANAAVNMDLPYNPAVLQQRIGRLDRIIQESKFIEIHNLILAGSLEETIRRVIEDRIEVFKGIIGGMEDILEPDDEGEEEYSARSASTEDEANRVLASMTRQADVDMLAESDVLLRVVDSHLDGEIGERRRALHPLHSRRHLVVSGAMERLGAESRWDEDTGVLRLRMSETTRRGIMGTNAFFPWGADHVYAAFESVDSDGWVTIPMRGREAVIGPLHPFQEACTSILLSAEGMSPSGGPAHEDGLHGSDEGQYRWEWVEGEARSPAQADSLASQTSEGLMTIDWSLSDDPAESGRAAYGGVRNG